MSEAEELEVEVIESIVPQGDREESVPAKEAGPITMPLSGDCPLCVGSLEQLVVRLMAVVAG